MTNGFLKTLLRSKSSIFSLAFILHCGAFAADFNREGLLHYWNGYEPISMTEAHLPPVGVEVEGTIHESLGRKQMAFNVARTLRSRGVPNPRIAQDHIGRDSDVPDSPESEKEYLVTTDTPHQPWHIKNDPSVRTPLRHVGAELVTPILSSPHDLALFKSVITQLHALGFKEEKNYAGVHVHVDFSDERIAEVLVLTRLFAAIEPELFEHFDVSPSRVQYANPIATHRFIQGIDKKAWGFDARLTADFFHNNLVKKSRHENEGRFFSLNLLSLLKHGTVEFRLFNSTLDPEEIELMVDFCARLVKAVRTKDARLDAVIRDLSQEITFDRIANAVKMKLVDPNCIGLLTYPLNAFSNASN